MSHEEFFKDWGDYAPQMVGRYGGRTGFSLEYMYQAFKARMMAELCVKSDELLRPAELANAPDNLPPTCGPEKTE